MNLFKKIKRKLAEEKGITIMVAYVLFFPIFLISITLLFEMTKIQSLKNINECITDISTNAAARQVDYQNTSDAIQLNEYNPENSNSSTDNIIWGMSGDPNFPLRFIGTEYSPSSIQNAFKSVNPEYPTPYTIKQYDDLSAESIALALYSINAQENGLNNYINGTKVSQIEIKVNNLETESSTTYKDATLAKIIKDYPGLPVNENILVNYPSVFMNTHIQYRVNPMMVVSLLSGQKTIGIGASSVAQIVATPSSSR